MAREFNLIDSVNPLSSQQSLKFGKDQYVKRFLSVIVDIPT